MSELVSYSAQDGVFVIAINNPPVNALSPGVPEGIAAGVEQALEDNSIRAIVLIGQGKTFIAGADIKEFAKIVAGEATGVDQIHTTIAILEECYKPVVCAIHGTALGGGLEIAMGCHYRVAVPTAIVGQPEVLLGIFPGAGGTQRLPRLCGLAKAAELCATGRNVKADEALASGIVDEIVEGDLLAGAIDFAKRQVASDTPPRKTREIDDRFGDPESNQKSIALLKQQIATKARGQIAPLFAIECVELSDQTTFTEGLAREAEQFQKCLFSPQSQGMIHVFFGERVVNKVPGLSEDLEIREIQSAAVVGAGTMGGGIAMAYANAGIPVVLKEVDQQQLDKGLEKIRSNYLASVKRGKLTEKKLEKCMSLISPTVDYSDLSQADIVVEAVFENMELKKKVFAEIDAVAKAGAILATNTSTLNIDELAAVTGRPGDVIGHHFFSPANIMKLLEIVRGQATTPEVIATSMKLAKRLRKVGVLVGNCFGFVANSMFCPYLIESELLLEEGATVEQVDQALFEFGLPMGPLAVSDLAGIDVLWRIKQEGRQEVLKGDRAPLIVDQLYEQGRYGQKTGAGWYQYDGREASIDPSVESLIRQLASKAQIPQQTFTDEEIVQRTILTLVNEGAWLLEQGIALRSVDIDIIYVHGFGFPAWRGGPMNYADSLGLDHVLAVISKLHKEHGERWKPAPLLKKLAKSGGKFRDDSASI